MRLKTIQPHWPKWICTLVLCAALVWPQFILAGPATIPEFEDNGTLPVEIEKNISYLLELVHNKGKVFDPAAITPLLDFVIRGGDDFGQLKPAKRDSGNGIILRAEVNAPLKRILRYAYNPHIPHSVLSPSALRLNGWYPDSDIITRKVELWNELSTLNKPLLLWGREYEVNTPDLFSGSYYRYDLNRLFILLKHNKKKILIAVSKMPKPSEAGKKAVIIDEKNWDYFYSGIQGLGIKLIGFLQTYIYDSASVQILYETDAAAPRTKLTLFKWLKAGWADLNMVKSSHIYEGGMRYIKGFKEVMESNSLPPADVMAKHMNYFNTLNDAEINAKIRDYSVKFERIAKKNKNMSPKDYASIIANGGYAKVLRRDERLGVLALECIKNYLGKAALIKFDFPLLPQKKLAETDSKIPLANTDSL